MQVPEAAFPRRSFRSGFALAAMLVVAATAIPAGAQTPDTTGGPRKPGPTLIQVTAGPDEVTHVVKRGDTLWDIAKAYLKDPFRWPDVFRRNTDIVENPHWIYPGETIRIPATEVRPEVLARVATTPAPKSDQTVFSTDPTALGERIMSDGQVLGRGMPGGVPVGEIEAAPYGARRGGPTGSGRLAAAYDRPGILASAGSRRFQIRDRVFVDLPRGAAGRAGEILMAYRLGPVIGDDVQVVIPTGLLRVESLQPGQPALARVMRQFGEIALDQRVISLETLQPSVGNPVAVSPGPAAKVIYIDNEPVLPSIQSYVILSSNPGSGVRVGDQFTLIDDTVDPRYPAPPVPAAVGEVVRVMPNAVTVIIVDQEQPRIFTGMPARLTGRAP
ncbi:MAG: LysM peptidoglycan-binding domain-containing protein [Gemmatimonadaceae bacterium]